MSQRIDTISGICGIVLVSLGCGLYDYRVGMVVLGGVLLTLRMIGMWNAGRAAGY